MFVLTKETLNLEQPKLIMLAKGLVFLSILCLMISVPLLNKFTWVAIVFFFIGGDTKKHFKFLIKDPVIIGGLGLILLFLVGILYSQASPSYSLRTWNKYLKISYLFFFLPMFINKNTRQMAIICLMATVMLSEVATYLHYFNVLTFGYPTSKHWLFVQDIDAGFIVSFMAYVFANVAIDNKKFRWLSIVCFAVCSIDVLFLNLERTGYLIYLGLAALFLLQRFRWKGFLSAIIMLPLLFAGLYMGAENFHSRVDQVATNIIDYQKGNELTSIGLRLAFAEYSFEIIKRHILFGVGTGSFEEIYTKLNGPKIDDTTWPAHPHNEYILIWFQIGLVGLLAFLYWIHLQIRASFQLPRPERLLLQGLILSFLLLSFCNASLLVNPAGACYIIFLAVFLAAKYDLPRPIK